MDLKTETFQQHIENKGYDASADQDIPQIQESGTTLLENDSQNKEGNLLPSEFEIYHENSKDLVILNCETDARKITPKKEYDSDEELQRKLELSQGQQYEEWLEAATEKEEAKTFNAFDEYDHTVTIAPKESQQVTTFGKNEGDNRKDENQVLIRQETCLQEPYGSCLKEFEDEKTKLKSQNLLQRQINKIIKREESRHHSIQLAVPTIHNGEIDCVEPWKYLPATELECRQRTLEKLNKSLEFEVKQRKSKQETFHKRWEKLESQLATISQALQKLQDLEEMCREKRHISIQLANDTIREIRTYNEEIENANKEHKCLTKLLQQQAKRLEAHKTFTDFLEEVKQHSLTSNGHQFKSVRQITERFQLLQSTKNRLMYWEECNQEDILIRKEHLHNTIKTRKKNNQLTSNFLYELRRYNENNSNQLCALEEQLELVKAAARKEKVEFGQINVCIHNLYLELCNQIKLKPNDKYTNTKARTKKKVLTQLEDIEACMKSLQSLRNNIRESATAATQGAII